MDMAIAQAEKSMGYIEETMSAIVGNYVLKNANEKLASFMVTACVKDKREVQATKLLPELVR